MLNTPPLVLGLRRIAQLAGLAALIVIGILHSLWAPRLDSYIIDEPRHTVALAGASDVRTVTPFQDPAMD